LNDKLDNYLNIRKAKTRISSWLLFFSICDICVCMHMYVINKNFLSWINIHENTEMSAVSTIIKLLTKANNLKYTILQVGF
jgi:hypothetical protein